MNNQNVLTENQIERLCLLSQSYPNIQSAAIELINLNAITNLPKGTEHFISDLHGEYETFRHIMNNASGTIREKVDIIYDTILSTDERAGFSALIYYPDEKLQLLKKDNQITDEWYKITLNRLIEVCRLIASKYTRSKVRKALPDDFAYIIDELLHNSYKDPDKVYYVTNIIDTIIQIHSAEAFIKALCATIKRLAVAHLHIIGDIFDCGPRPDKILDDLLNHHSLDIEWGNHDVVWMGAACGSEVCIAVALANSIAYSNLSFLEEGYGINLRNLALFAEEVYQDSKLDCFHPATLNDDKQSQKDQTLLAKMYKAITIIRFKLEGQAILRHPEYQMNDRLLLAQINYENHSITIDGKTYTLKDIDFPTIQKSTPFVLTAEETELINQLKSAFVHSEKLQRHVRFLYENGCLYRCYNDNILFHGCIPQNEDGSLMTFEIDQQRLNGKDFLDAAEQKARSAFVATDENERQNGGDFMWFLWCGKNSPLFAKEKMTTFERLFINDSEVYNEKKNAYYKHSRTEEGCIFLLFKFGLNHRYSHIINGHMPVISGHHPVKANGRLIIIDGGFCKAYQPKTGIAGYTLIYNSQGIRLCAHEPFAGINEAIHTNTDIHSTSVISQKVTDRIKVGQTDKGIDIKKKISDLSLLVTAFRQGIIKEHP